MRGADIRAGFMPALGDGFGYAQNCTKFGLEARILRHNSGDRPALLANGEAPTIAPKSWLELPLQQIGEKHRKMVERLIAFAFPHALDFLGDVAGVRLGQTAGALQSSLFVGRRNPAQKVAASCSSPHPRSMNGSIHGVTVAAGEAPNPVRRRPTIIESASAALRPS
jgi:hypothetical protein